MQVHGWSRLDYLSELAKDLGVPPSPTYIEAQTNVENKVGPQIGDILIFVFYLNLAVRHYLRHKFFMISLYLYFLLSYKGYVSYERHLRRLQKTPLRWMWLVVVGDNDKKDDKQTNADHILEI